jgi:hypothetical protein
MGRLAILSVHYRYRELLADQAERIRRCARSTRELLGAELSYHPVIHPDTRPAVAEAALATAALPDLAAACIDLRGRPPFQHVHGQCLEAAFERLCASGALTAGDLVAILDHDTHPLHPTLFAAAAGRLLADGPLAGVGIPQWHRGHRYLHPSFLLSRVETVVEMGAAMAFRSRPGDSASGYRDTAEGFTTWCERRGLPTGALRVCSTAFPWSSWDSDMVPGGGAELAGEHGERIHVGNLMRYGLDAGRPLVSHVWAAPLLWQAGGVDHERKVLAAYLAEPLED